MLQSAANLSDAALLDQVAVLAANEREATAHLIAALVEVDARRLYLPQGCSSLFTYCTQVLHLSEHAAYNRIEAARAGRRFPAVLEALASGSLHLTAVTLLAPHLTMENHVAVLAAAHHKGKREVERLVATLCPQPAVPTVIRKLPTPRAVPQASASGDEPDAPRHVLASDDGVTTRPADPALIVVVRAEAIRAADLKPLTPDTYKVQLTVSRETHDKLRLAQDLLRHTIPSGDVAAVVDRALTLLVQELQTSKHAAVKSPRPARETESASPGRHVPAAVRREVWARDGGQCAFAGAAGRCTERGFLEYHHRVPFADGGPTTVNNIELRCRGHNQHEAERWFGAHVVRETAAPYGRGVEQIASTTRSGPTSMSDGGGLLPRGGCYDPAHISACHLLTRSACSYRTLTKIATGASNS